MAVARLRRVLEPASAGDGYRVLVTRPPGYELRIGPDGLDLHRFERLLATARSAEDPATAARTLREALGLWRGRPLADLGYEPFCQADIARLEELRLVALEDRVDADLALGGGAELVAELEALVQEQPLRERLRGQLLVALYRSGRQADALEAYQAARRALVDELGIEPGPRLRELHQAILEQDAALEPAPAPAAGAAPAGVFVGRARELAELRAGVDDAFAGRGRLFLLSGEPGIGKSRLAEELARIARARGATVLVGRCWEAGGAPAYWPWIQALRPYVRACDADTLAEQAGAGAADLAQVVPELADRLPGLPPPSTLEPDLVRFRLFDATAEFLRRVGEARPVVLVLDDLHAADEASLLLLRFLARELGADRLLAARRLPRRRPAPRRSRSRRCSPRSAASPRAGGSSCAGSASPRSPSTSTGRRPELASPRLAAALHERTEGNPLFVGELVRLLAIEGEQPLAVPPSVRDVIARRMTHLTPQGRELLVLASVLGREFRRDVLARLARRRRRARCSRVSTRRSPPGCSPTSPARPTACASSTCWSATRSTTASRGARRMRLHERAVEALERLAGAPDAARLAELAQHAGAAGDHAKALRAARDGAGRALEAHGYEEAARLYGLALDALERLRPAEPRERLALLMAAGDALASAGSIAASKARFLAAAEVARSARRPADSRARRSATAAGPSGSAPATTTGSCRCWRRRWRRSARPTGRCGAGCWRAWPGPCATSRRSSRARR